MIKHVVMFKFREFENKEQKFQILHTIKTQLEALPSKIEQIKSLEAGINLVESERSFDMVLNSSFNSLEELKIYVDHPEHQKVVTLIKTYSEKVHSVDYQE